MHCDETNQAAWLTTPDDNSSGRLANECILDMDIQWTGTNTSTEPTLTPGSPAGGNYFSFDGIDDSICVFPGWLGGDTVFCDFSFRYRSLSVPGDLDVTALVMCDPWTCFLNTEGGTEPHISVMISLNYMVHSPVILAADEWYDVSVRIINDDVSITVNGDTYTEHSPAALPNVPSFLSAGYYLRAGNRYLDGDMDEIRVGTGVPEPFTFGLIGLLGLLVFRK